MHLEKHIKNARIIPYRPEYEPALKELEAKSPQGNWIRLEMVKENFLSRAKVFDRHATFLFMDAQDHLVGACSAGIVELKINGRSYQAGIPFDMKVDPTYRKQGLAKKMLLHARDHYFLPNEVMEIFSTTKSSNTAVLKLGHVLQRRIYHLPFVYLTIPVYKRLGVKPVAASDQRFFIRYFGQKEAKAPYCRYLPSGLGIWHTHKMYQVRLEKVAGVIRLSIKLINFFRPAARRLPGQGAVLRFSGLFDFRSHNLSELDQVLELLEQEGVTYLSVCCQKGDDVYRLLKPLAINVYDYMLLSTMPLYPGDKIELDIRCL